MAWLKIMRLPRWLVRTSVLVVLALLAWATVMFWPAIDRLASRVVAQQRPASAESHAGHEAPVSVKEPDAHAGHAHEGHDHGHDDQNSLELSPQALNNLGLSEETIRPIELTTFRRSISVPGIVVARPGRTQIQVATPMTGVITHVHAVKGEAVDPGSLLFQIRLTHEDLVLAQTEFMKALLELEVENREITRLRAVSQDGAIPGNTLLQRQYAKEKLEALLLVQRESLRLHGLSDAQINTIARDRRLLRELQIAAPTTDDHNHEEELRLSKRKVKPIAFRSDPPAIKQEAPVEPLLIEELDVHKGQSVDAGTRLCVLADYSRLYIEGSAFEQDVPSIVQASDKKWEVTAKGSSEPVQGLSIAYISNEVDTESRTLHFYVDLPNQVERSTTNADDQRFVTWKYRPGQRMQLELPVEEWEEQIVLPVDAVARDGVESYVFQQNGTHFDRVPVHVRYQDQTSAVIANDGSLFPGDQVALKNAHQLQMALKNKSGGGVDPHAGHNH